jgi:hypothetical protein
MGIALVSDSATIGTTEYYLASDSTSKTSQTADAVLQVWIDFAAMTAAETYQVKVYEKINTVERVAYVSTLTGVQAGPLVTPSLVVGEGWEVSVKKIAGTDRAIGWSLRTVS